MREAAAIGLQVEVRACRLGAGVSACLTFRSQRLSNAQLHLANTLGPHVSQSVCGKRCRRLVRERPPDSAVCVGRLACCVVRLMLLALLGAPLAQPH